MTPYSRSADSRISSDPGNETNFGASAALDLREALAPVGALRPDRFSQVAVGEFVQPIGETRFVVAAAAAPLDLGNLQPRCVSCHNAKAARKACRKAAGLDR